jgi:hypothetical protein
VRQLAKHRVSNNVGVVNQYWRTLQPALDEERYFAHVEDVPIQPRLARNQGSGLDSVRPMHLTSGQNVLRPGFDSYHSPFRVMQKKSRPD